MQPLTDRKSLASPAQARRLLDRMEGHLESLRRAREEYAAERRKLADYLAIAGEVSATLDRFSEQLFAELVGSLQTQLSNALQEVLDQPIELKVDRDLKAGAVTLAFYIDRAGQREDIMKGQGGSVVNVLSVGLRLLALSAVEEKLHRRFLILDEQDCWLRPDLVPRLVHIVHEAGKKMGFQVLMISHHDPAMFEKYADCIYRCLPINDENGSGVAVERVGKAGSGFGE